MKQTENYIWNSFLNSGKKHLILTGTHRAGKTTRFQALCNHLKEAGEPLPGITTYAVPGKEVLLKDNATGQEMKIGVFDPEMKGSPMRTVTEGFLNWAVLPFIVWRKRKAPGYLSMNWVFWKAMN